MGANLAAVPFALIGVHLLRIARKSGAYEPLAAGRDPGGPWLALIDANKALFAVIAPLAVVSVWLPFSPPAAYRRWLAQAA